VGFLRRLLGGAGDDDDGSPAAPPPTQEELDEEERAHELELARFEQDRTTDLVRRQQRYSNESWTPPAQGGTARAGESEDEAGPETSEG
jgi:hypothetical protein